MEKVFIILYTGVPVHVLAKWQRFRPEVTFIPVQETGGLPAADVMEMADVFVIGSETAVPLKWVQQIYVVDKYLSVLLLVPPEKMTIQKKEFQFLPFFGKNFRLLPFNTESNLVDAFFLEGRRTRQRRSFSRIKLLESTAEQVQRAPGLEFFSNFFREAPIAAILVGRDRQVITFNQLARDLFEGLVTGVSPKLASFFEEDPGLLNILLEDPAGVKGRELRLGKKVLALSASEFASGEEEINYIILFNDVTERSLEASRIRSILEALPQMAWTASVDGRLDFLTREWVRYTGQTVDEAFSGGWSEAVHPGDREKFFKAWTISIESGKVFQQTARYRGVDGRYAWHLVKGIPIKNAAGDLAHWVGTATDINEQVLLSEELERQVGERTVSLLRSNNELEQFAHISSHDLQEPLRKITIFADRIREDCYEKLGDASKRYLDKIEETSKRMATYLQDLLNFTRLNEEELFTITNLQDVVKNCINDLEVRIQERNATIAVDVLPELEAIPIQMYQLFYNLINNALKFNMAGRAPMISVTANAAAKADILRFIPTHMSIDYWEIIVRDNGIGFDQGYAERIFAIFHRLHAKSVYEGTGIGLALCKKVAINHSGWIYALSEPEMGSAFHILLPAKQPR